jgi:hypothetical protein
MFINPLSSAQLANPTPSPATNRRQQEDLLARQLAEDIKSGDLKGAQQDYAKLSSMSSSTNDLFSNPNFQAQFQAIGQDLQNGDLASAQKDFTSLGKQFVTQEIKSAYNDYKSGDANFQQSLATLQRDYWAVYGKMPSISDLRSMVQGQSTQAPGNSTGTDIQA